MRIGLLSSILPKEIRKKINELIRLSWTREPVAGYGMSISRRANGTVFSCTLQPGGGGSDSGGGSSDYDGPFRVSLENGYLSVDWPEHVLAGYAYVNGRVVQCHINKTITPQAGTLTLQINNGNDSYIFRTGSDLVDMPRSGTNASTCYYPIAEINGSEDGWKIKQILRWHFPQLWIFGECE